MYARICPYCYGDEGCKPQNSENHIYRREDIRIGEFLGSIKSWDRGLIDQGRDTEEALFLVSLGEAGREEQCSPERRSILSFHQSYHPL